MTDPTAMPIGRLGEPLIDGGARFWKRLADPDWLLSYAAMADSPGADSTAAETCLLARAAADALADPEAGSGVRLRALGCAARIAAIEDPGVSLSLDDLELREGSTESSRETRQAATLAAVFDPELAWLSGMLAGYEFFRLLIDTDQQLPAALALLSRIGAERAVLCGRFAIAHQDTLSRLPELRGARWDRTPVRRAVRGAQTAWADSRSDIPETGRWSGWFDVAQAPAIDLSRMKECTGLVLSVARLHSWECAVGADGTEVNVAELVRSIADSVPLAVEMLIGAPGVDDAEIEKAISLVEGTGARLAGFRPFRLPAGHGDSWHRERIHRLDPDPGNDLPRWTPLASPDTESVGRRTAALLKRWSSRRELFSGRVTGALTSDQPRPLVGTDHVWDPAVRLAAVDHTAPTASSPGHFLVNLRTGHLLRLSAPLAALARQLRRGGQSADAALQRLSSARRAALLNSLSGAGIIAPQRSQL